MFPHITPTISPPQKFLKIITIDVPNNVPKANPKVVPLNPRQFCPEKGI
jgi:hypothetical protein